MFVHLSDVINGQTAIFVPFTIFGSFSSGTVAAEAVLNKRATKIPALIIANCNTDR